MVDVTSLMKVFITDGVYVCHIHPNDEWRLEEAKVGDQLRIVGSEPFPTSVCQILSFQSDENNIWINVSPIGDHAKLQREVVKATKKFIAVPFPLVSVEP